MHCAEILRNIDTLFADPRIKSNVIYFFNSWQPTFDQLTKEGVVAHWEPEPPTIELIRERVEKYKDTGGSVVVIDDRMQSLSKELLEMYTVYTHHWNCVVITLCQNIFNRNPVFREISLNSTYVTLFKNPRDASQINHFAKQVSPGRNSFIVDAFHAVTEEAFGYMLFDNHQLTPSMLRVRSHILPHQQPMRVYVRKTSPI